MIGKSKRCAILFVMNNRMKDEVQIGVTNDAINGKFSPTGSTRYEHCLFFRKKPCGKDDLQKDIVGAINDISTKKGIVTKDHQNCIESFIGRIQKEKYRPSEKSSDVFFTVGLQNTLKNEMFMYSLRMITQDIFIVMKKHEKSSKKKSPFSTWDD